MPGMMVTWLQKTEKLRMPSALARMQRQRGRGRRGLEADGEEHRRACRDSSRPGVSASAGE